MKILKKILIPLLILLVTSCSPQARMTRLVTRHPELAVPDTIKYSGVVVYPARASRYDLPDSILRTMQPGDSIISVSKKGVTIIIRKKPQVTEIEATVPSDTVRIDTSFVVSPVKVMKSDKEKLLRLRILWAISVILILLVTYTIIRKIIGK